MFQDKLFRFLSWQVTGLRNTPVLAFVVLTENNLVRGVRKRYIVVCFVSQS